MKPEEILSKLEEYGSLSLSDEFCKKYGMYDNSGLIADCGGEIKGILFSLDLSKKAVNKALELGYNLIVTHHPAIYGGISRIKYSDPLAVCIKNGISVISMHLNYDAAENGIDYYLMCGLGGKKAEILCNLNGGGYGRVYAVDGCKFSGYFKKVCETFGTSRSCAYGDPERNIKKVASFCGAGYDGNTFKFALQSGADVFVSSDLKHHEITSLTENGLNVIHLTHYSSENYGFKKIYDSVKTKLQIPSVFFTDKDLL